MSKKLQYWRDGHHQLTLAEAALLIVEEYPDEWVDSKKLFKEPPHGFIPIYRAIRASATTVINEHTISEEDINQTCIEYELHTDKDEHFENISEEDGLSIFVGQGQLKKWIEAKGMNARFFTDDKLSEFNSDEKELGTREKNTLLVIIAALAKEAKIDITTHAKSAIIISEITQKMGTAIDDETISKKLKLIPHALERRSK